MPDVVYRFGDFQLDCGRVERKPMELLILLASAKASSLPAPKSPSASGRAVLSSRQLRATPN